MSMQTATDMRFLVACTACKRQFDVSGFAAGSQFHCSCGEIIKIPRFRAQDAAVVRCSSCSAPRRKDALSCKHCGADYTLREQDLHTICPACMTRVSDAARYCHHCATPIVPQGSAGTKTRQGCPVCGPKHKLNSRVLGKQEVTVLECPRCAGIWLAAAAFELLAERAREKTLPEQILKGGESKGGDRSTSAGQKGSLYRRCPECDKHMNRRNYGRRSGVIIDICKDHGMWFDAQELGTLLRWIQQGGEAEAHKRRQMEQRNEERKSRLKLDRAGRSGMSSQGSATWSDSGSAELFGSLLGKLFDL